MKLNKVNKKVLEEFKKQSSSVRFVMLRTLRKQLKNLTLLLEEMEKINKGGE